LTTRAREDDDVTEASVPAGLEDTVAGVVVEAMPDHIFQVALESGGTVTANVSTQLRKAFIRVTPGDRVRVRLSPYLPGDGVIAHRHR
jgi:translation initiation factor IF-1